MDTLELFTGAGGLALGIANAGFKTRLVIERNRWACDTLRNNQARGHKLVQGWEVLRRDVTTVDYRALLGSVDMIAGGPPCQPFSVGGKHRANADHRDMFPEAVRAVRELKPRAFIFENVKGLCRQTFQSYFSYIRLQMCHPEIVIREGEGWERHLSRLERQHTGGRDSGLTYKVVHRVLNAADYGVPQKRERVFFVGIRSDLALEFSFPDATHSEDSLLYEQWVSGEYWEQNRIAKKDRPDISSSMSNRIARLANGDLHRPLPWRTLRQAIASLPAPSLKPSDLVMNHLLVPGARSYPGHTGSPLDMPAKTLKAGVHGVPGGENMILFPDGRVRYLTVREAARLQSFPDDYELQGSWSESMRQLGNAVPVSLAAIVAAQLRSCLSKS